MLRDRILVATALLMLAFARTASAADLTVTDFYAWPRTAATLEEATLAASYGDSAAAFATAAAGSSSKKGFFLVPFSAFDQQISQPLTTHLCKQASKACEKDGFSSCEVPLKRCQAQALDGGASPKSLLAEMLEADHRKDMAKNAELRKSWLSYARSVVRIPLLPDEVLTALKAAVSKNAVAQGDCLKVSSSQNAGEGTLAFSARACEPAADEDSKDSASSVLRAIYASLWSEDAYLLRESKNIAHEAVYSGALFTTP